MSRWVSGWMDGRMKMITLIASLLLLEESTSQQLSWNVEKSDGKAYNYIHDNNKHPHNPHNKLPHNPHNKHQQNPHNKHPQNPHNKHQQNPHNKLPHNPHNKLPHNPHNKLPHNPHNKHQQFLLLISKQTSPTRKHYSNGDKKSINHFNNFHEFTSINGERWVERRVKKGGILKNRGKFTKTNSPSLPPRSSRLFTLNKHPSTHHSHQPHHHHSISHQSYFHQEVSNGDDDGDGGDGGYYDSLQKCMNKVYGGMKDKLNRKIGFRKGVRMEKLTDRWLDERMDEEEWNDFGDGNEGNGVDVDSEDYDFGGDDNNVDDDDGDGYNGGSSGDKNFMVKWLMGVKEKRNINEKLGVGIEKGVMEKRAAERTRKPKTRRKKRKKVSTKNPEEKNRKMVTKSPKGKKRKISTKRPKGKNRKISKKKTGEKNKKQSTKRPKGKNRKIRTKKPEEKNKKQSTIKNETEKIVNDTRPKNKIRKTWLQFSPELDITPTGDGNHPEEEGGKVLLACPARVQWIKLTEAITSKNEKVNVYQNSTYPPQWFYTQTCNFDVEKEQRACPKCCIGVDHEKYTSLCHQKYNLIKAQVNKGEGTENYWAYIRVNSSCGCHVSKRN